MDDQAIASTALTKRYRGDVLAVDRVDLRVARGEIYAFLGVVATAAWWERADQPG